MKKKIRALLKRIENDPELAGIYWCRIYTQHSDEMKEMDAYFGIIR